MSGNIPPSGFDEEWDAQKKKERALENASGVETLSAVVVRMFSVFESHLQDERSLFDEQDNEFVDKEDVAGLLSSLEKQKEFYEDWSTRKKHESNAVYMEAPELAEQADKEALVSEKIAAIVGSFESKILALLKSEYVFGKELQEVFGQIEVMSGEVKKFLLSKDEEAPKNDVPTIHRSLGSLEDDTVDIPLN